MLSAKRKSCEWQPHGLLYCFLVSMWLDAMFQDVQFSSLPWLTDSISNTLSQNTPCHLLFSWWLFNVEEVTNYVVSSLPKGQRRFSHLFSLANPAVRSHGIERCVIVAQRWSASDDTGHFPRWNLLSSLISRSTEAVQYQMFSPRRSLNSFRWGWHAEDFVSTSGPSTESEWYIIAYTNGT